MVTDVTAPLPLVCSVHPDVDPHEIVIDEGAHSVNGSTLSEV